jgi:hypothetical protein
MGRKQQAKRLSQEAVQQVNAVPSMPPLESPPRDAVTWVLGLPRLLRIILIAIPAMATTIIFVPVVDSIYLRYFFSMQTRMLPSIIEAGIALTVYLIGWVLVVGTSGEKPQERRAVRLYLSATLILMALASVYLAVLLWNARD